MTNNIIYRPINIIDYMLWLGIDPKLCQSADNTLIRDEIMYRLRHDLSRKPSKTIIMEVLKAYMPMQVKKLHKKI